MIARTLKRNGRAIVVVCDKKLMGKKFEEGKLQLDLGSDFYKGEEMDEESVITMLKGADIINLVGENAINAGLKARIIEKGNIIHIKKIPHAQSIKL